MVSTADVMERNVQATVAGTQYSLDDLKRWIPSARRRLALCTGNKYIPHRPHKKQAAFLTIPHQEAMYGGAAGGGKSDALLMAALQYVHVPGYTGLLLRRSYKDLSLPGALMDRAQKWLTQFDKVDWSHSQKTFTFPSGARLVFGYLASDADVYQYQSAEFQFIAFDELTQFEEFQYTYLFSRLRRPSIPCAHCGLPLRTGSAQQAQVTGGGRAGFWHNPESDQEEKLACDNPTPDPTVRNEYPEADDGLSVFAVPLRMRSATNPGGTGHAWVTRRSITDPVDTRPFIPALLDDNPYVDRESYEQQLKRLDPVTREQLLRGDWEARPTGGMFMRSWFDVLPTTPKSEDIRWVRFWDLAGTNPSPENPDPDYTVGLKMGRDTSSGVFYISDVRRVRRSPRKVELLIQRTAKLDGISTRVVLEQEPGATGKSTVSHIRRNVLSGYDVRARSPSTSKFDRAKPVSSDAEAGNLVICNPRQWNVSAFFDELEGFHEESDGKDDQVDALSGAHHELTHKLDSTSGDYDLAQM